MIALLNEKYIKLSGSFHGTVIIFLVTQNFFKIRTVKIIEKVTRKY